MADNGVLAVWSGNAAVSLAWRIADGIVLGRELLPDTTDDRLSRVHARISRLDGRLVASDAGSRNGTFVNGHAIETGTAEVVPGTVIRTGRTIWTIVADVAHTDAARKVRAIAGAARAVAPEVAIHASLIERCLLFPPTHRPMLELVAEAATAVATAGRDLRGDDLETDPNGGVFAVFPGIGAAIAAARRLAAKLSGSTTRALIGGSSLVDARNGERRVTITCPPSTAYFVELYADEVLVAAGHTLEDSDAVAVATAWLGGTLLDVAFLRGPTR
jgi:FHA domain